MCGFIFLNWKIYCDDHSSLKSYLCRHVFVTDREFSKANFPQESFARFGLFYKLVIVLTKAAPAFFYKAEFIKWLLRFIFSKSVVFPAQAEYSYFTADLRLKIFLYDLRHFRFRIFWGINYKCLVSRSVRI